MASYDGFLLLLKANGIPPPTREYRFAAPGRRWRLDYAWPDALPPVGLEVEGGVWTGGRHTRGKGFLGDIEKYNRAALMGWVLLRCTPSDLKTGDVIPLLKEALGDQS